jgi:hypothetical protein
MREAERDEQAPPHPGRVARVEPVRVGGVDLGQRVEALERVDGVGTALDPCGGVAVPERLDQARHVRQEASVTVLG